MTETRRTEWSIGADIIEIDRFRHMGRESNFIQRVFTKGEIAYCYGYDDPAPHLAATFAAKEATLKALSGVSDQAASLRTVEILREASGAPYVRLGGLCTGTVYVSLSHSATHAIAVALYSAGEGPSEGQRAAVDDAVSIIAAGDGDKK